MYDLKVADNIVIRLVQQIETLRNVGAVATEKINEVDIIRQRKTSSKLHKLDPFLDNSE